jgi:hypothetical protein
MGSRGDRRDTAPAETSSPHRRRSSSTARRRPAAASCAPPSSTTSSSSTTPTDDTPRSGSLARPIRGRTRERPNREHQQPTPRSTETGKLQRTPPGATTRARDAPRARLVTREPLAGVEMQTDSHSAPGAPCCMTSRRPKQQRSAHRRCPKRDRRLSSISKVWVSTIETLVHAAFRRPRGDAGRSLRAPRDRVPRPVRGSLLEE